MIPTYLDDLHQMAPTYFPISAWNEDSDSRWGFF